MSKRCLILVEVQTEERFVKDIVAPFFAPKRLFVIPTLLVTKRVKSGPNFKGGVTSFANFERELRLLLNDSDAACVTTLLDYYGLPEDFPGMSFALSENHKLVPTLQRQELDFELRKLEFRALSELIQK